MDRFGAIADALVGASACLILVDEDDEELPIRHAEGVQMPAGAFRLAGTTQRVMETGRARFADEDDEFSPAERRLLDRTDRSAIVAIPIGTGAHCRGVGLLVVRRVPLFVRQSMSTLTLLGEMIGVFLHCRACFA